MPPLEIAKHFPELLRGEEVPETVGENEVRRWSYTNTDGRVATMWIDDEKIGQATKHSSALFNAKPDEILEVRRHAHHQDAGRIIARGPVWGVCELAGPDK